MVGADDAWKGAKWAWENRKEIAAAMSSFRRWWKRSRVLVIGPGGTGKTTLARILSGQSDWLMDSPWEYRESWGVDHFRLKDDPGVEVVVPPGQRFRSEDTWPGLLGQLAAGKYRGVILTACYGYHVIRTSYKEHILYAGNKDDFLTAYLSDRRAEELRVLRVLAPHLVACPSPVWLLTVVSKQDLWCNQHKDVEDHYLRGEFAAEVDRVRAAGSPPRIRYDTAFASLVIGNFDTENRERVVPNTAGYDHRRQIESVRRLFEMVAALRAWEGQS